MSGDGSLTRAWGDGEYRFRLAIGQLRELESSRNSGALEILQRFAFGTYRVDDVSEILRLGLIGGGLDPLTAKSKVTRFFVAGHFSDNVPVASEILKTAIIGDESDPVGKEQAEEPSRPVASASPTSSGSAQPWDGPSQTLTPARSGNLPPPSMAGTNATGPRANGPNR